jgi:RND family efflux transporter MFP subunit
MTGRGLLIAGFVSSLVSCAPGENPEGPPMPRVSVAEVTAEMVSQRVWVFGTVAQRRKVDVYPRTEGRILELFAEEGDRVSLASPLVQLETVQLDISLERARAEVESKRSLLRLSREKLAAGRRSIEAQRLGIEKMEQEVSQKRLEAESLRETLENRERLFQVGGVAEGELDVLRTQYQGAQTSLFQAEKDLEIARIGFRDRDLLEAGLGLPSDEAQRAELFVELNVRRLAAETEVAESELEMALGELSRVEILRDESLVRSPIAGVVGRRYLDPGEKATPETLLFTVFDTGSVFAEVHIPEDDLPLLAAGQPAELVMERGDEELPLSGRVHLISPFLDPQSRSARVRILLENPERMLVPGMFLRGSIEVGLPQRELTLPLEAVAVDGPLGSEVLLLRGETVFRLGVETGQSAEGRMVILAGLEEGDLVVSDATRSLTDGTRVEVVQ